MEILYHKLVTCIDEHRLITNTAKTKCVIFSNRTDEPTRNTELNGDVLQAVKAF